MNKAQDRRLGRAVLLGWLIALCLFAIIAKACGGKGHIFSGPFPPQLTNGTQNLSKNANASQTGFEPVAKTHFRIYIH